MDGRDGIMTSGGHGMSSFYIHHRGSGGPSSGSQAAGLHPSGFRHLDSDSGFSFQQPQHVQGSSPAMGFQDDTDPPPGLQNKSVQKVPPLIAADDAKKKRKGRPRKYNQDGGVMLGLSPSSSTPPSLSPAVMSMVPVVGSGSGSRSAPGPLSAPPIVEKRGRGRPPGSGKVHHLSQLGKWVLGSFGTGFTPHVIIVQPGEDVAARIIAFCHQGQRSVCILSATGALSAATLRQPDASGGIATYEGQYEILCLSGSCSAQDDNRSQDQDEALCIALCSPDHKIVGGIVGGVLKAAGIVQVIVGSFIFPATLNKGKSGGDQEGDDSEQFIGDSQPTSPPGMLLYPNFARRL